MVKKEKKILIIIFLIILTSIFLTFLVNNLLNPTNFGGKLAENFTEIIVTRNFGQEVLLKKTVKLKPGMTALDVLKLTAKVETRYGGGFIYSINNLSSKFPTSKEDWFYYVNGFLANVGANQYFLRGGETIQFDFHNWDFYFFTPAIVGGFPKSFVQGYAGKTFDTIILYEEGFKSEALKVSNYLKKFKIKNVKIRSLGEITRKEYEDSNLIVIGKAGFKPILELNNNWKKLGLFMHFDDDKLYILDVKGGVAKILNYGGVIQATQNPWNPKGTLACEKIVLIISGLRDEDVKKSVKVLLEEWEVVEACFALLILDDNVYKVPLC